MENTKRKYEFNKLITTAQKAASFVVAVVVDLPLKGHAYGRIGVALLPPPVLPRHHASTTLTQPRQLKPVPDTKQQQQQPRQQQQQKGAQKKVDEKVTWGRALCAAREVQSKGKQEKGREQKQGGGGCGVVKATNNK